MGLCTFLNDPNSNCFPYLCRWCHTSGTNLSLLSAPLHLLQSCTQTHTPPHLYVHEYTFAFSFFLLFPYHFLFCPSLTSLFPSFTPWEWLCLLRWMCAFPGQMALLLLSVAGSHFNTRPACLAWQDVAWEKKQKTYHTMQQTCTLCNKPKNWSHIYFCKVD